MQSQKMFFPRTSFSSGLQRFILVILGIFVLIFTYLAFDQRLLLKIIPIRIKHLHPIAKVVKYKGDVRRKLQDDILWLPSFDEIDLYIGDSVFCSKDSTAEIAFDEGHSIFIGENSLVKISLFENKPLIELVSGEIKAKYKDDQEIYVKEAGQVKKKATSEFSPLEETQPDQKLSQPKVKKVESKPKPEIENIALQIYPKDKSVFLHLGLGRVIISSGEKCATECSLKLTANGRQEVREFAKGQVASWAIDVAKVKSGRFSVIFNLGTAEIVRNFEILPYNKENFDNAVKSKNPVEVVAE